MSSLLLPLQLFNKQRANSHWLFILCLNLTSSGLAFQKLIHIKFTTLYPLSSYKIFSISNNTHIHTNLQGCLWSSQRPATEYSSYNLNKFISICYGIQFTYTVLETSFLIIKLTMKNRYSKKQNT